MFAHHHTNINRPEDVQQSLMALLLDDQPLDALAQVLHQAIGQTVLVIDTAGRVLAGDSDPALQKQLTQFLQRGVISRELQAQPQIQHQATQLGLEVTPLLMQHDVIGLLVTKADVGTQDKAILQQGGQVIGLALLKFQAAQDQLSQQRQTLLDDVLTSEQRPSRHLIEQASALGWTLEDKPIVILVSVGRFVHQTSLRQVTSLHTLAQFQYVIEQVLDAHCPLSILAQSNNGFIILPHCSGSLADMQNQVNAMLDQLTQAIKRAHIKEPYALACGDFHQGLDGLRQSYSEAEKALDVGNRLKMRSPIRFEEIYLYLLLERSGQDEDVQNWVQRTLGPLVEYDRRNKTEMLQTLEAYFDTNQTLQDTAYTLHIHPNTLKYRLGRITQILDQDPFKGENQLRFYLATKMARLLEAA
ncbi:MAG: helix-turn-helix domain-containing protein [Chloroflexota bacterium]